MDKKHRGAWSELKASAWLLEQGYEVFRNISQHGKIDIIARHPETLEIVFFDVKTTHWARLADGSIKYYTSTNKASPGVKILGVYPHSGECKIINPEASNAE